MGKTALPRLSLVEVFAGGGGQALGFEAAGFEHLALVDNDEDACATLRLNRPDWNVCNSDISCWAPKKTVAIERLDDLDVLAGGVPCPPFSLAGKQRGHRDERDLFPTFLELVAELQPRAVMIENVRGLLTSRFDDYREWVLRRFDRLGYAAEWKLLQATDFGVPQKRPRSVLVAMRKSQFHRFFWPAPPVGSFTTVGEALRESMSSAGWEGAAEWARGATGVAPTVVGGSKKHGGPDLGPSSARKAWLDLGIDGRSLAVELPGPDFQGLPRLTVEQVAILQGFPPSWRFVGTKTSAYRQVGNAFPPPFAAAVATQISKALRAANDGP